MLNDLPERPSSEGSGRSVGRARPGRPTMAMVAERVGVSVQTVSFALNTPDRVSTGTLRKVLKAVDELGYRPNQAARSLRTRSPQAIGYRLFPAMRGGSGGVLDGFLYELSVAARAADHDLLCHGAATDEEEIEVIEETARRGLVDCFVVTATREHDPRIPFLLERRIPFALFGRPWGLPLSDSWWVDVDGAAGVEQGVDHLAERGHTRIAYLGWKTPNGLGEDRESGWHRATRARGLPIRGLIQRGEDDSETGQRMAARLLERPNPPTAFSCASDALAIGALRACHRHGLVPGRDIGIVGFDDSVGSRVVTPSLTTIAQPLALAAQHTVRLLLEVMKGTDAQPEQVLLRPTLVVRDSSQPR